MSEYKYTDAEIQNFCNCLARCWKQALSPQRNEVSENSEWNAEREMYPDCTRLQEHDMFWFHEHGIKLFCKECWQRRVNELEAERDSLREQVETLREALRKIQSEAPISDVSTDNYWKQIADKMGDIAAAALAASEEKAP